MLGAPNVAFLLHPLLNILGALSLSTLSPSRVAGRPTPRSWHTWRRGKERRSAVSSASAGSSCLERQKRTPLDPRNLSQWPSSQCICRVNHCQSLPQRIAEHQKGTERAHRAHDDGGRNFRWGPLGLDHPRGVFGVSQSHRAWKVLVDVECFSQDLRMFRQPVQEAIQGGGDCVCHERD